jgi:hypothetical protein
LLGGLQVELPELLGVVEGLAHRIRQPRVLAQDAKVQLVRPPVAVSRSAACRLVDDPPGKRTLALPMIEGGYDIGLDRFTHELCLSF